MIGMQKIIERIASQLDSEYDIVVKGSTSTAVASASRDIFARREVALDPDHQSVLLSLGGFWFNGFTFFPPESHTEMTYANGRYRINESRGLLEENEDYWAPDLGIDDLVFASDEGYAYAYNTKEAGYKFYRRLIEEPHIDRTYDCFAKSMLDGLDRADLDVKDLAPNHFVFSSQLP